jgi:hypothetical protein
MDRPAIASAIEARQRQSDESLKARLAYANRMFGVTFSIQGISYYYIEPLEDAVLSVLKDAELSWSVTLLGEQGSSNWKLRANVSDSQGTAFEATLADDMHSPDCLKNQIDAWYLEYKSSLA